MNNFPEYQFENMGGVSTFKFVPQYWIDSIPIFTGNQLNSAVVLKAGFSWLTGLALPKSLKFDETPEASEAGDLYKYLISGNYVGQSQALAALFDEMRNQPFVLDIIDNNNQRRLLGNLVIPLTFRFSYSSKTQPSDRPDYSFTFGYSTPVPAPFYNPA
jgi:hypothetical protein